MNDADQWKKRLTPQQYNVLHNKATEPPFSGAYLDTHEAGVYRCAACGNVVFSSKTKFDSGSGWPSFYDVVDQGRVKVVPDRSLGAERNEVVCARCGGHLGHVFDDAPSQPTGLRYCINSVALDFKAEGSST